MPIIIQKPLEASIEYNKLGIDKIDDLEKQFTDVHDASIGYYGSKAKGEDLEQVFKPGWYPRWDLKFELDSNRSSINKNSVIIPLGASFDSKFSLAGGGIFVNYGLSGDLVNSTTNYTATYYQISDLVNSTDLDLKNRGKLDLTNRKDINPRVPLGVSVRYNTNYGSAFSNSETIDGPFFTKADYPLTIKSTTPTSTNVPNLFTAPAHYYTYEPSSGVKGEHVPINTDSISLPIGVSNIFNFFTPRSVFTRADNSLRLFNAKSSPLSTNSATVQYYNPMRSQSVTKFVIAGNKGEWITSTISGLLPGGVITFTQNDILTANTFQGTPGILRDFRALLRDRVKNSDDEVYKLAAKSILSDSPNYETENIEARVLLGDPGNMNGKDLTNYDVGAGGGAASITGNGSYDQINASVVGSVPTQAQAAKTNSKSTFNDLVHFRIRILGGSTVTFRAYLNSISDNYDAEWKGQRYIGRGENLYTYGGFDRKISLSWTVVATSRIELIPMYKRLNYLASMCAPSYVGQGYMKGNIAQLTIGGYLWEHYGLINKVGFEIPEESSWEINIGSDGGSGDLAEMPHMIKVSSFEFIPIHNFAPQIGQPFISLKDGAGASKYFDKTAASILLNTSNIF